MKYLIFIFSLLFSLNLAANKLESSEAIICRLDSVFSNNKFACNYTNEQGVTFLNNVSISGGFIPFGLSRYSLDSALESLLKNKEITVVVYEINDELKRFNNPKSIVRSVIGRVYVDGKDINFALVEQGMLFVSEDSDVASYLEAQNKAKQKNIGMWWGVEQEKQKAMSKQKTEPYVMMGMLIVFPILVLSIIIGIYWMVGYSVRFILYTGLLLTVTVFAYLLIIGHTFPTVQLGLLIIMLAVILFLSGAILIAMPTMLVSALSFLESKLEPIERLLNSLLDSIKK